MQKGCFIDTLQLIGLIHEDFLRFIYDIVCLYGKDDINKLDFDDNQIQTKDQKDDSLSLSFD